LIDKFWCDGKDIIEIEPYSCLCCTKCWFIAKGKKRGKCVYGGPYLGYIVADPKDPPETGTLS